MFGFQNRRQKKKPTQLTDAVHIATATGPMTEGPLVDVEDVEHIQSQRNEEPDDGVDEQT